MWRTEMYIFYGSGNTYSNCNSLISIILYRRRCLIAIISLKVWNLCIKLIPDIDKIEYWVMGGGSITTPASLWFIPQNTKEEHQIPAHVYRCCWEELYTWCRWLSAKILNVGFRVNFRDHEHIMRANNFTKIFYSWQNIKNTANHRSYLYWNCKLVEKIYSIDLVHFKWYTALF